MEIVAEHEGLTAYWVAPVPQGKGRRAAQGSPTRQGMGKQKRNAPRTARNAGTPRALWIGSRGTGGDSVVRPLTLESRGRGLFQRVMGRRNARSPERESGCHSGGSYRLSPGGQGMNILTKVGMRNKPKGVALRGKEREMVSRWGSLPSSAKEEHMRTCLSKQSKLLYIPFAHCWPKDKTQIYWGSIIKNGFLYNDPVLFYPWSQRMQQCLPICWLHSVLQNHYYDRACHFSLVCPGERQTKTPYWDTVCLLMAFRAGMVVGGVDSGGEESGGPISGSN
uniref:Phosphoprotein 38 n=1 Tax=Gallid alphaherpesvirus 2 TaxID=10390 RepID=C0KLZ9_9ALPH|nr:phosphoprotein 38 [Gallid alphaherpesvirus 2]